MTETESNSATALLPTPPRSDRSHFPENDVAPVDRVHWWNINLSEDDWTDDCPDFLLEQCAKNIDIMSTRNEDYKLTGWNKTRHLIETGQIDRLGRTPTELRRYSKYTHGLKARYGSILSYIQHERLKWPTVKPSGDPSFTNPANHKILYNDWPYALDPNIKHLVVWTKFPIEEVSGAEQLTLESYNAVEDFVTKAFYDEGSDKDNSAPLVSMKIKRENVIWFKNWARLRSVHALEHIHVMLYKASPELLKAVIQGDYPMSKEFTE